MIQTRCRRLVPLAMLLAVVLHSTAMVFPAQGHSMGKGWSQARVSCPAPLQGPLCDPTASCLEPPPLPAPSPSAAIIGRRDGGLWRGLTCRGGGGSTQGDLGILPSRQGRSVALAGEAVVWQGEVPGNRSGAFSCLRLCCQLGQLWLCE